MQRMGNGWLTHEMGPYVRKTRLGVGGGRVDCWSRRCWNSQCPATLAPHLRENLRGSEQCLRDADVIRAVLRRQGNAVAGRDRIRNGVDRLPGESADALGGGNVC